MENYRNFEIDILSESLSYIVTKRKQGIDTGNMLFEKNVSLTKLVKR